jgi:hypothetical protein
VHKKSKHSTKEVNRNRIRVLQGCLVRGVREAFLRLPKDEKSWLVTHVSMRLPTRRLLLKMGFLCNSSVKVRVVQPYRSIGFSLFDKL